MSLSCRASSRPRRASSPPSALQTLGQLGDAVGHVRQLAHLGARDGSVEVGAELAERTIDRPRPPPHRPARWSALRTRSAVTTARLRSTSRMTSTASERAHRVGRPGDHPGHDAAASNRGRGPHRRAGSPPPGSRNHRARAGSHTCARPGRHASGTDENERAPFSFSSALPASEEVTERASSTRAIPPRMPTMLAGTRSSKISGCGRQLADRKGHGVVRALDSLRGAGAHQVHQRDQRDRGREHAEKGRPSPDGRGSRAWWARRSAQQGECARGVGEEEIEKSVKSAGTARADG